MDHSRGACYRWRTHHHRPVAAMLHGRHRLATFCLSRQSHHPRFLLIKSRCALHFSQKALRCAILLYAISRCSRHWFRVGAHLYHGHHSTSARRKPSHRPHRPLVHAHLLAVRARLSLAQEHHRLDNTPSNQHFPQA